MQLDHAYISELINIKICMISWENDLQTQFYAGFE